MLINFGIICSLKKIEVCIGNVCVFFDVVDKGEDFLDFCWSFVDGKLIVSYFENYCDGLIKMEIFEVCLKVLK